MGLGSSRQSNNHTTADVLAPDTSKQKTGVVTSARLLAGLLEGFDIGDPSLDWPEGTTHNFDVSVLLQDTTLDTTRSDSTTSRDRENFLDGHQEGLVEVSLGGRNPGVHCVEKLVNLLLANLWVTALQRTESRAEDDWRLFTLESIFVEQLAHLQLDQFQHLLVLDNVDLVNEDDDFLDTDLTSEEQVLTGLGPSLCQCDSTIM